MDNLRGFREGDMACLRILKLRQIPPEYEFHTAHWSIAVLGDNDFGDVFLKCICFVLIWSVDE